MPVGGTAEPRGPRGRNLRRCQATGDQQTHGAASGVLVTLPSLPPDRPTGPTRGPHRRRRSKPAGEASQVVPRVFGSRGPGSDDRSWRSMMMRVLVTAASRHGATTEIADAIGAALREAGLETSVVPPDEVLTLAGYDAVVLGSAVYMGRWLDPAKQFAARNGAALAARPVWLFSCGPIGDPPKPTEEPVDVAGIREATGARATTGSSRASSTGTASASARRRSSRPSVRRTVTSVRGTRSGTGRPGSSASCRRYRSRRSRPDHGSQPRPSPARARVASVRGHGCALRAWHPEHSRLAEPQGGPDQAGPA